MPISMRSIKPKKSALIDPELFVGVIATRFAEFGEKYLNRATTYPPRRRGSRYVRTFRLRDSWNVDGPQLNGDTITLKVLSSNTVATDNWGRVYNFRVMGADGQAAIHKGRWITDESIT